MTAIQDGMDQAKFKIPRLKGGGASSKLWSSLFRPRIHTGGSWFHGKQLLFALSHEDVCKDSAAQVEQLVRGLDKIHQMHGTLPLGLCCQQDNTYREGKNRFYLAFIIGLIGLKVFRWTVCNYLRVGHRPSSQLVLISTFYRFGFEEFGMKPVSNGFFPSWMSMSKVMRTWIRSFRSRPH